MPEIAVGRRGLLERVLNEGAPARRAVAGSLAGVVFGALLYAAHVTLGFGGRGHAHLWNHWLYDGVIGVSGLLCFWRAWAIAASRRAWAAIGGAIAIYWLADIYWSTHLSGVATPPYPSWADAGWLAYYVPLYAGLILLLGSRVSSLPMSTWLEGLLGALALASVAAVVVFDPVVAATHGSASVVATNLAYPTLDVLLLAFVALGFGLLGHRAGKAWVLLGLALFIAGVGDSIYLYQTATGTYAEGTWVNALWPVSVSLIAVAAWAGGPAESGPTPVDGSRARLALTSCFASMIVGVLILDRVDRVPFVAHVLVVLSVVVLVARLALAGRERQLLVRTKHEARTDDLTGLPNRRQVFEHLDHALSAGEDTVLLLLDINRFKEINDTLGHNAGDELLSQVAARLSAAMPESAVLARLGGDEYVALLHGRHARSSATQLVTAMQRSLEQPFSVAGLLVPVQASIGIALAPDHARSRTELMRCADVAMYRAKTQRTGSELYGEQHGDDTRDGLLLAAELSSALKDETGQILLHYQPMTAIAGGQMLGVEALVCWQHPRLGLVDPRDIVPEVEHHELMRSLALAVLDLALTQQRGWREDGLEIRVAVDMSPANLMDARLPEDISLLLRQHDLAPHLLQLEITEEAVIRDPRRAQEVLARLGEMGIDLTLDECGTGYSSLAGLTELPLHELKIDRSFITQMTLSDEAANIVRFMIALAHSLELTVLAEGVETAAQLTALSDYGCDGAQGLHISRPLLPHELEPWLARARTLDPPEAVTEADRPVHDTYARSVR